MIFIQFCLNHDDKDWYENDNCDDDKKKEKKKEQEQKTKTKETKQPPEDVSKMSCKPPGSTGNNKKNAND